MGKLLQFPMNRVVRNIPEAPELSEEQQDDIKKEKFIEQLTQYKLHLCPSLDNDLQYISILESQAFGIPVIARETATIYDCIYHNETGYIARDKQTFANKVH